MIDDISLIAESAVRLAATLLFAALGELVAERAGTLNISIEGMMLSSAFGAVYASHLTGSAYLGFLLGMAVAVLVAAIQANLAHRIQINQFVLGIVVNLLVIGTTSFLWSEIDITPERFPMWRVPGLASIPVVGDALFHQRAPFFLIYLAIPLVWWILERSRWGLELQAVGENPQAADVSGIDVLRRRRQAIYFCGAMAGIAGSYLSIGLIGTFTPEMTALRGFIAIAAVIFGGWVVWRVVSGTLLFGGVEALRVSLPALGFTINAQLLIVAPYLVTLIAMAFFARRNRPPKALGKPFERGIA
jgi:general nucleoside transport system permease protein